MDTLHVRQKTILACFRSTLDSLLRYLHTRDLPIIHRDLKTSNALLTAEGNAKVPPGLHRRTLAEDICARSRLFVFVELIFIFFASKPWKCFDSVVGNVC